jgi:DUF1680 family protein
MKSISTFMMLSVMIILLNSTYAADARKDYPVQPVPFTAVQIADEFWSPRMETNRKVTIPYAFKMCEDTGRIDNFAIAGRLKQGKFRGIYFNDSDVYKVIEGAAYSLAIHPAPELDKYLDDLIVKIAAAQEKDGYLYTARTLMGPDYTPPGGKERWSDMAGGHELYCVGHLYEGAVAHYRATGKRTLLNVAIKNADLVCNVFGPGKRLDPCGHQEIEIGLCKLYRVTGDEKYLQMAKFFLDERGNPNRKRHYGQYSQDHKPVVEQDEAVGHSVRAAYMYSGMADVAALTGDDSYVKAIERIWNNVVSKKMYVTGGIGSHGGSEGFGPNYSLPNPVAYCETCASIANALWNHRMFLMTGDAKYMDVVERVIYNGFLSGISMAGNEFFYPNPLESFRGTRRSPWFDCACCPSNVTRFVPSIPGYAYAHRDRDLYVNLFIGGLAKVRMGDETVRIKQDTRYPWEGTVTITVEPERALKFALNVRIPGWARGEPVPSDLYQYNDKHEEPVTLKVNGKPVELDVKKSFARIEREWKPGDVVELVNPMPVRRVVANDQVEDDRGRVALERGPIVFCAEGVDNKDGRVLDLMVEDQTPLKAEYRKDLLNGIEVIRGKGRVVSRAEDGKPAAGEAVDLMAIPYYAWAHRGPSQMAVWLARKPEAAKPRPRPTIAATSRVTVSAGGDVRALNDQLEPRNSDDHSIPYFHWWPKKNSLEWVQYEFKKPEKVSSVRVYWFDDRPYGGCRVPASWRVLYKDGAEWKPVANKDPYVVEKDKFTRVTFEPLETSALRLEVQLPKDSASGIHEFSVE